VELLPAGVTLDIVTPAGIPLYNADIEVAEGLPPAVVSLKEAIVAADGLLLATPEYNNGIPGVFKNMIDWASRPANDIGRIFGGKPVALMGASPGGFGTILSQDAWLGVLRTLGTRPWFEGRLLVSRAGKLFDDDGHLTDPPNTRATAGFSCGLYRFPWENGVIDEIISYGRPCSFTLFILRPFIPRTALSVSGGGDYEDRNIGEAP